MITLDFPTIVSIFSGISVVLGVIFSLVDRRKAAAKELEERVKSNTEIIYKLDSNNQMTQDIKENIKDLQHDFQALEKRVSKVEFSTEKAHTRLDAIAGSSYKKGE